MPSSQATSSGLVTQDRVAFKGGGSRAQSRADHKEIEGDAGHGLPGHQGQGLVGDLVHGQHARRHQGDQHVENAHSEGGGHHSLGDGPPRVLCLAPSSATTWAPAVAELSSASVLIKANVPCANKWEGSIT